MSKLQQERLMARIKNLTGTGTVTGATTNRLQIRTATGRTNDRINRLHNYGFMSHPLVGAKTYNLFIGGVTARGFTVSVEDKRYQMELKPGEVAMLDDKGNVVHFTEEGIKVTSPTKVLIDTPETEITGNVKIGKNLYIDGKTNGKGDGVFAGVSCEKHTHNCNCGKSSEPNK